MALGITKLLRLVQQDNENRDLKQYLVCETQNEGQMV